MPTPDPKPADATLEARLGALALRDAADTLMGLDFDAVEEAELRQAVNRLYLDALALRSRIRGTNRLLADLQQGLKR